MKVGDIYISKPLAGASKGGAFSKPQTLNERLILKDHLAELNRLLFVQTGASSQKSFNSNMEIPG